MAENKKFPVLRNSLRALEFCPRYVKWDALNEEQAINNHAQDLKKLASRGGLSVLEILANIRKCEFLEVSETAEEALEHIIKIQWHPTVEKKDYSGWYRLDKDKELIRLAIAAATKRPILTRKDSQFLNYLAGRDPGKCIYIPNRIKLIKICREKLQIPIDEELD